MNNLSKTAFGINFPIKSKLVISELSDLLSLDSVSLGEYKVMGQGTNMIIGVPIDTLIILENKFINFIKETDEEVIVEVGAGLSWDDLVSHCTESGYAGLEALSAIPGTVGAAPVQNIGAYGAELCDSLVSLTAFDLHTRELVTLANAECKFGYRDSIFKSPENKNKYIIWSVQFKLIKSHTAKLPDYKSVYEHFINKYNIQKEEEEAELGKEFSIQEIREAIVDIRWSKLPRPSVLSNLGSFFHNPIIEKRELDLLVIKYPKLINHNVSGSKSKFKLSAGQILEILGFRGYKYINKNGIESLGMYDKNALVMVNYNETDMSEVVNFINIIKIKVKEEMSIDLAIEPEIMYND
jgi:UDP-N-acetylmuramate dehydrogenase